MWAEARHQKIRSLLQRHERLTTEQAMQELGTSRETVRRDFIELEALGLLQRVHGGAIHLSDEPPIDKRNTINVAAKRVIALAAAQRLRTPVTIFMDAGSTTTILARELAQLSGITLITNSLNAAQCFAEVHGGEDNQVIVLSGVLNTSLLSTTGSSTVLQLRTFRADVALLSPVAVNARQGASSFQHDEAIIARAMSENAEQTWILADHSKIGAASREAFCPADHIHLLVTDHPAKGSTELAALQEKVGEIVLA